MEENQNEITWILIGSIVSFGGCLIVVLVMVVMAMRKQSKKNKLTDEIYEQTKERPNGRH